MLIVRLFVSYAHVNLSVSLFLLLLVSGVGRDFCLWFFLDFSVYLFDFVNLLKTLYHLGFTSFSTVLQ